MNADILRPFPAKVIKQVPRGGGGTADFVSWTDKIQRLMQLGVGYDWQIVATFDSGDEREPKAVHGRLIVRIPEGDRMITRAFDGIGQGRDAKTASTDAFSRACAFMGLGLHLWCRGGTKDGGYWITGVLDE